MIDPAALSALESLPPALLRTVEASFADRLRGVPLAAQNLDVAWYAPRNDPRTPLESLACTGATSVNVLVRLHARIQALDPSGELWSQIRYLLNSWFGGCAGFKVVFHDPAAAAARLDALAPRVARDLLLGGLEHQHGANAWAILARERYTPADLLSARPPPDCDTWREIDRPNDEALHFCIGKRDPRVPSLDDIHIDWRSPVIGFDPAAGRCRYDLGIVGAAHWAQAMLGWGKPLDPFTLVDARLAADHDKSPAWAAFAARWREAKWSLAVQGKAGYRDALAWWRDCQRAPSTSTA